MLAAVSIGSLVLGVLCATAAGYYGSRRLWWLSAGFVSLALYCLAISVASWTLAHLPAVYAALPLDLD